MGILYYTSVWNILFIIFIVQYNKNIVDITPGLAMKVGDMRDMGEKVPICWVIFIVPKYKGHNTLTKILNMKNKQLPVASTFEGPVI